jgi:hypothetical protein
MKKKHDKKKRKGEVAGCAALRSEVPPKPSSAPVTC